MRYLVSWYVFASASNCVTIIKVKIWTLLHRRLYKSKNRDQQSFTISEVAADWHEPMVQQRIMWPSIARANGQLDPRCN